MCHKKGTLKFSHWSGGCFLKLGLIRDPEDFKPVLNRGWRETGNSFFRCGALWEHSVCLWTGGLEGRSNSIFSPALLHCRWTSQGLSGRREYFCMSPGMLASLECHHNVTGSVKDCSLPHWYVTQSRGQLVCALTTAQGAPAWYLLCRWAWHSSLAGNASKRVRCNTENIIKWKLAKAAKSIWEDSSHSKGKKYFQNWVKQSPAEPLSDFLMTLGGKKENKRRREKKEIKDQIPDRNSHTVFLWM